MDYQQFRLILDYNYLWDYRDQWPDSEPWNHFEAESQKSIVEDTLYTSSNRRG